MQNQVYAFIVFILNGLLIGLLFDIFRVFRKSFKTADYFTYLEDILFWFLSTFMLIYSIFKFNNGELRLFIFIGVLIGISLYILIFSKMFINVSVHILNIIKAIFKAVIVIPIKFIIKILEKTIYKPIISFIKFLKKRMSNFKKNHKKMFLTNRNYKNKKDFA